jgi:hypothetical protein
LKNFVHRSNSRGELCFDSALTELAGTSWKIVSRGSGRRRKARMEAGICRRQLLLVR